MPHFSLKQRFKIALGGLLSLIGFIVLIFTFIVITEVIDFENISQSGFYGLIISILMVLGGLDILAGILLARSR